GVAARLRVYPRLASRRVWQSSLPPLATQFQPADGDGGAGDDRGGRGGHPAGGRDRPGRCAPARHLRAPPGQDTAAARRLVAAAPRRDRKTRSRANITKLTTKGTTGTRRTRWDDRRRNWACDHR